MLADRTYPSEMQTRGGQQAFLCNSSQWEKKDSEQHGWELRWLLYSGLRPGQTYHSKVMHRKEITHSDGSYEEKSRRRTWLTKWDKVKIPWYTHRLMHRKRVTSELHDSYFRLMTIKHAIPKIEWAIELLYNSVKAGSQRVGVEKLESGCGRESQYPAEGALRTPDGVWRPIGDKIQQRKPVEWAPRPLVEHQENEKDTTLMAIRVGVNILQSLFSLQLPLTRKPYNKVRGIFFLKKSSLVFLHCGVVMFILHESVYEYTTWRKGGKYGKNLIHTPLLFSGHHLYQWN